MSATRGHVLGVDGGNSKTVVAIADLVGNAVASTKGGPSDLYTSTSPEVAVQTILSLVSSVLDTAELEIGDLAAVVCSLAGADWPEDIELLTAEIARGLGLPSPPLVMNDAIGGLWSGTDDGEGIAIVVGTFNAVGARHRDGGVFHCGFWPDRTGGFDLGSEALKAVYREGLGLGAATDLTRLALEMFAASDPMELLHSFTRREAPVPPWEVQRMAPVLLDCATAGDEVALAIVRQAGAWLGDEGRVCAQRVGLELPGTPVVLTGGVLSHPSDVLVDAVMERLPGATPVRGSAPPIVGALRCGLVQLGRTPAALADNFT